jgi:2-dehydropantoate 2-reductase
MKIAVLGGAGAMGALFGAKLAGAGYDVTLVDVHRPAIDHINAHGVTLEDKAGHKTIVKAHATDDPMTAGAQDYVLVFTKCYHTEGAVKGALPMVGPHTAVVSLQNGWGNAPRIASIVGQDKVLAGVTYNSGVLLGLGHTQQAGAGMTFVGELDGALSERLRMFVGVLQKSGFDATESTNVLKEIWAKLALNVCTLPAAALLQWEARKLVEHESTMNLMAALLKEVVTVAHAQNISMDYEERWSEITGLLRKIAPTAKGSMVVDVEKKRRTEVDVINGAIVDAGKRLGIPTPYNDVMVWMVKALEETF